MRHDSRIPQSLVDRVNRVVLGFRDSKVFGGMVRRHLSVVRYTGRRSGREFSTPVAYRRSGDVVTIPVSVPDSKNWWRNFLDEGGPISLELDGGERTGHATSRRDGTSRVTVTVLLDQHPHQQRIDSADDLG